MNEFEYEKAKIASMNEDQYIEYVDNVTSCNICAYRYTGDCCSCNCGEGIKKYLKSDHSKSEKINMKEEFTIGDLAEKINVLTDKVNKLESQRVDPRLP